MEYRAFTYLQYVMVMEWMGIMYQILLEKNSQVNIFELTHYIIAQVLDLFKNASP